MDLFSYNHHKHGGNQLNNEKKNSHHLRSIPLWERLRPQCFSELVGQDSLFSKKSLLNRIQKGYLQSWILWGPPGSGKTSFARCLSQEVKAQVLEKNAMELGSKEIRQWGEQARRDLVEFKKKTIVFVDEIHRLNRSQQDVLLPYVEKAYFYLIGATTENPSYQLTGALMSRCRLLVFEPLKKSDLNNLMEKALESEGLEEEEVFQPLAKQQLIESCHGDARRLLICLEEIFYCVKNKMDIHPGEPEQNKYFPLTPLSLKDIFTSSGLRFDQKGDEHYDTVSVFIKSIRGSDPNAAIYYLARLLEGGEDPLFIARRLVILASEDVGNADPLALTLAVSGLQAVEFLGFPEARITLAQMTTYLSSAPKSNRSYKAMGEALEEVRKTGPLPIPKAFRSSQTHLMKGLGYGKEYKYPHEGDRGWVPQEYMPPSLKGKTFYKPVDRGFEKKIKAYLSWMKQS